MCLSDSFHRFNHLLKIESNVHIEHLTALRRSYSTQLDVKLNYVAFNIKFSESRPGSISEDSQAGFSTRFPTIVAIDRNPTITLSSISETTRSRSLAEIPTLLHGIGNPRAGSAILSGSNTTTNKR